MSCPDTSAASRPQSTHLMTDRPSAPPGPYEAVGKDDVMTSEQSRPPLGGGRPGAGKAARAARERETGLQGPPIQPRTSHPACAVCGAPGMAKESLIAAEV